MKHPTMKRRIDVAFLFGALCVFGLTFAVLVVPLLRQVDPVVRVGEALLPPVPVAGSTLTHPLGTDQLGRDTLSRLLYGGRTSLTIAWISVLIAGAIGTAVGLGAGYLEGRIDSITMRVGEAIMAFPMIILALLLVATMIPGPEVLVGIFAFASWPHFAKIVRGAVLVLKHEEYIVAPRALGGSDFRIMFRHLLPNVLPLVLVVVPLQLATVVYAEAGLSFIGVGIQPPTPSWGSMLSEGRAFMLLTPWLVTIPGLALLVTVLGANLLGDSLQERFDPKRRAMRLRRN